MNDRIEKLLKEYNCKVIGITVMPGSNASLSELENQLFDGLDDALNRPETLIPVDWSVYNL